MKKFLILTYILIVASLSISARANTSVDLFVDSIEHDVEAKIFQVKGQFPVPCISNPAPQLIQDKEERLVLNIVGESTAEVCVQVLGPRFLLAVDLNVLKSELSRLRLDENGTHRIHDRDGHLIAEVDFKSVFYAIPFTPETLSGKLVVTENGIELEDPRGLRFQIKSPMIDLEGLSESHVTLTGHMLTHAVSKPVFRTNVPAPRFIATGVSYSAAD